MQESSDHSNAADEARDDEVDDYMSEEILQSIKEAEKQAQPKQLGRKRKPVENPVAIRKLMKESIERGQEAAIDQDSLGFKLMAKLGYQEGSGLGKHGQGITDALKVRPKEHKQAGLGIEENIRRKQDKIQEYVKESRTHQERTRAMMEEAFPDVVKQKLKQRNLAVNLPKARRAIMDLDTRADKEPHELWPKQELQPPTNTRGAGSEADYAEVVQEEEDDEHDEKDEENEAARQEEDPELELEKCIAYLRQEYFYCLFCGTRYDSLDDLREHCPGPREEDHEDL